jgi:hypothetical protein
MPFPIFASLIKRVIKTAYGEFRIVKCDDDGVLEIVTPSGKWVDVFVQDQTTPPINLYLYRTIATPILTATVNPDDRTIYVDSIASILPGDAITFYEGINFSQSLVDSTQSAPNRINLKSPMDLTYSTSAIVEIGDTNANLDGSGVIQELCIGPPSGASFDIYSMTMTITDNVVMDSAKYGGISSLNNGIVLRAENSIKRNFALIFNNIGFAQQGSTTIYDDKAPAGFYGVRHSINVRESAGVALRLDGITNDKIKLLIQDDLRGLNSSFMTVLGHVVMP